MSERERKREGEREREREREREMGEGEGKEVESRHLPSRFVYGGTDYSQILETTFRLRRLHLV